MYWKVKEKIEIVIVKIVAKENEGDLPFSRRLQRTLPEVPKIHYKFVVMNLE